MIERAAASDPALVARLAAHPRVAAAARDGLGPGVRFDVGEWRREVRVDDPTCRTAGVVELMDNNPLVCASVVSLPPPVASLALLALGPALLTGATREEPVLVTNLDGEVGPWLGTVEYAGEAIVRREDAPEPGVFATGMIVLDGEHDARLIAAMYEERYEKAFFVNHREAASPMGIAYTVESSADGGATFVVCRLRAANALRFEGGDLLHAMNVMCGYEESLGLA